MNLLLELLTEPLLLFSPLKPGWLRQEMFSLKGETDAPIPATSSSHTSGAPRCAMWCSVLHGSSQQEHRTETGAAASGRLARTWAHRERALFFRGCSAPAYHPPEPWYLYIDLLERVSYPFIQLKCVPKVRSKLGVWHTTSRVTAAFQPPRRTSFWKARR